MTKKGEARCILDAKIGEQIKEKYRADFEAIKKPYAKAVLESVSTH